MTIWRGIRWSTAWLFVPLITAASYAGASSEREFFGDYPLVAISQAWVSLVVVAPLFASWAAWDSARIGPWLDSTGGGTQRAKALTRVLGPGTLLAMLLVVLVVLNVSGRPAGLSAWSVMAAAWLTMMAAVLLGASLGMVAPRLVATPLALAATYAPLAIAVADPSGWSAKAIITGVVAPCCPTTTEVSQASITAVLATVAVVIIGGCLAICLHTSRPKRVVVLIGSVGAAAAIVYSTGGALGANGQLVARSMNTVCGRGLDGPEVCVWPEHGDELAAIRDASTAADRAARAAGFNPPTRWSEAPSKGAMLFRWAAAAGPNEHMFAFSIDMAHAVGCTGPESEGQMATYLSVSMGVPPDELAARDPSLGDTARELAELDDAGRRKWLTEHLTSCAR